LQSGKFRQILLIKREYTCIHDVAPNPSVVNNYCYTN
jgi:hypothetical protein